MGCAGPRRAYDQDRRRHGHGRHGFPLRSRPSPRRCRSASPSQLGLQHDRHAICSGQRRQHPSSRASSTGTRSATASRHRSQESGRHRRRHSGIMARLRAFAPKGSKVLMVTPIYNGFYAAHRLTRRSPRKPDEDGQWPLRDRLGRFRARASTPDTKVSILCNPHNPGGPGLDARTNSPAMARSASSTTSRSCRTRSIATSSPRATNTRPSPPWTTRRSSTTASPSSRAANPSRWRP